MRFARVHKVASYLLAVLGLVALCTGGELGGVATALLVVGVAGSWFAEGDIVHSRRYAQGWNVVVVLTLAIEVLRWFLTGLSPLTAAVEFAAMLQLSRLANRRTARDYQQITILAMLHLIAATVLGGGLSYAACFVGFVIVTPWALTLGHLRREIEGNYLADARAGRAGVPIDVARILRSRRVVGAGLLVGSSLLAIPIFAMTAVIFVIFPRIGLGIFSIRPSHGGHVTGLGDQVDLSGHGTIRDDPTIVLRLEPPDLGTSPPAFRSFRLRGAAFGHYDGRTWTRWPQERRGLQREGAEYTVRRFSDPRVDRPYRVVIDSLDPPVVLVPGHTVAIRVEPRIEAGLPRFPEITSDDAGEIRYTNTDELGLVYTAYVAPDLHRGGDNSALSSVGFDRYLQLPRISPRLAALAHSLTDAHPDTAGKAAAVQQHLQAFRYTLEIESGRAEQPIEDFLFRTHAGHCEYFSTAMAVLLRAVGVPTRNVTGFLGGTYNRYGNFYAIRQGDAHSWVEVYDPARGWVTFDPTPPARELPVARTGAFVELDAIIEAMRVRWRRYIVGFDLGTQARIAMRVMRMLEGRSQRGLPPGPTTAVTWARVSAGAKTALHRYRLPLGAAAILAALSVPALLLARRRARHTPHVGSVARRIQVRDAIALAEALDAALSARGHSRPRSRSPMGFANDLEQAGSPVGPIARRVANRYAAARYGDEPLASAEFEQLRRELREAPNPLA